MADEQIVGCSLQELCDAIKARIQADFPSLNSVLFQSPTAQRQKMPLPACLLYLPELEPGESTDPGTGQLTMMARFEARFVLGFAMPNAEMEVIALATSFATYLQNNARWLTAEGQRIGKANIIGCYKDEFEPDLDQFEVWRVEWTQEIYLGTSIWNTQMPTPQHVFIGITPNIGIEHIDDYTEITHEP